MHANDFVTWCWYPKSFCHLGFILMVRIENRDQRFPKMKQVVVGQDMSANKILIAFGRSLNHLLDILFLMSNSSTCEYLGSSKKQNNNNQSWLTIRSNRPGTSPMSKVCVWPFSCQCGQRYHLQGLTIEHPCLKRCRDNHSMGWQRCIEPRGSTEGGVQKCHSGFFSKNGGLGLFS